MTSKAYAKLNLFLDVISRRDDGFHDIRSIMHTVSMCDELEIDITTSDVLLIDFSSDDPMLANTDNLVYRAIKLYMSRCNLNAKITARLFKRIPIESGLGGGSSDAAAALRMLNSVFGTLSEKQMLALCAELGSDIPFLYLGKTAYCEGRGEKITPIMCDRCYHFVIAIGKERISTPEAYGELDRIYSNFDGSVPSFKSDKLPRLRLSDEDGYEVALYNIFEEAIPRDFGDVFKLKERLISLGASNSLMSGSGPAVFGIFDDEESARAAVRFLNNDGVSAFYAHSI